MAGAQRMTIEEVVRKVLRDEHADVIRESVSAVARELMEAEVSELIGAEHGERRPDDRLTQRNGYRPRRWDTRAGEIELQIPKLRRGVMADGLHRRAGAMVQWIDSLWSLWSLTPYGGQGDDEDVPEGWPRARFDWIAPRAPFRVPGATQSTQSFPGSPPKPISLPSSSR